MARMEDLSSELFLAIFHFLRHDKGTLKTCALVCSTWRGAAQSYLFRRVRVWSNESCQFLRALFDRRPELANHVREVHIAALHIERDQQARWIFDRLEWIHDQLSNVRHVIVASIGGETEVLDARWSHVRFPAIRELSLDWFSFRSANDYATVLACFPELSVLNLSEAPADSRGEVTVTCDLPQLSVLHLTSSRGHDMPLLKAINAGQPFPKLRTLGCWLPGPTEPVHSLEVFLATRAPSVETLCLSGQAHSIHEPIDFRSLGTLKRVVLQCDAAEVLECLDIYDPTDSDPGLWPAVITSQILACAALKELTLIVDLGMARHSHKLHWSALANAISSHSTLSARDTFRLNVAISFEQVAGVHYPRDPRDLVQQIVTEVEENLLPLDHLGIVDLYVLPMSPEADDTFHTFLASMLG